MIKKFTIELYKLWVINSRVQQVNSKPLSSFSLQAKKKKQLTSQSDFGKLVQGISTWSVGRRFLLVGDSSSQYRIR